MRDFKQQLKAYGDEMKNTHCPYSEAELDKEIRNVIWNTTQNEPISTPTKRKIWPAAAIIVAIFIPTAILINRSNPAGEITSIEIDGQHIYFACNNGCTPEGTLQYFKSIIQ